MKKETLLLFFLLAYTSTITIMAQPANDNVCDALEIIIDDPSITISNIGATIESGEENIVPPRNPDCASNLIGTWCDGNNDTALMNHTLWFKFITPSNTGVNINLCNSTFNTQVALYKVGDCSDWSTFEFIYATDDEMGCGIEDGLSSQLRIQCLSAGEEYYVAVDDWRDSSNAGQIDSGDVVIQIEDYGPIGNGVTIVNPTPVRDPVCPGGNEGSIDITLRTAVAPVTFQWSNGETAEDLYNLTGGTYSVTITDFCGSTLVASYDLIDPTELPAVVLGSLPIEVVHPTHCGTGLRGGQINPIVTHGIGPFSFQWSTGDTTAFVTDLEDGSHTVTITDKCGVNTLEKTYYIGATAGDDFPYSYDCEDRTIGVDNSFAGGDIAEITYNTDQTTSIGIACRDSGFIGRNATWRAFDFATDFGLSGAINLHGVEVFITSNPNFKKDYGVLVRFTAYLASTTALDDPNLELVIIDSMETYITEVLEYTPFLIPLKGAGLAATDKIAIKVETLTDTEDQHRFDFAANETPTIQTTYITTEDCGLSTPTKLSDIGFNQQIVMNLLLSYGTGLSYEWDGPVDDPTSPTPMALDTEPFTYSVTITDVFCGTTYTDEVFISCPVSTNNLVEPSFAIHPNPSSGEFQLTNEGESRKIGIQIFDLQGKLVFTDYEQLSNGETEYLYLPHLAKGIYFAKLSHDRKVETHRLIIQ